jgi:DNA-binding CsgD family transcriptional regulator
VYPWAVRERDGQLTVTVLRSVLDQLSLAIFIFRGQRLVYTNSPARRLNDRLRAKYRIELVVLLRDHLAQFRERPSQRDPAIALTGNDKEPFFVHLMELRGRHDDVAVSVREIGTDITAFKDRYRLSRREVQIIELVLHGYRNRDIAATLGITPATTKKHLSRVFDKVGVDSRAQLASRLA